MIEPRGLVIHIPKLYNEGTFAYQKDPATQVSNHSMAPDRARGTITQNGTSWPDQHHQ
jgi:hypothetical protein